MPLPSFPRRRESISYAVAAKAAEREWIPAFAGMTGNDGNEEDEGQGMTEEGGAAIARA